ncbi:ABC transporter substrate-binding protein [Desulfospira joergensenii]|uniref:ABC transporter substrate-binding protein n=1 Tax=Desulfospira joergensenii TaxID=53329 RepID=UPI0003B5636C|nr:ABC transporter substrate binding protein [Desulfospira joergensenii]
MMKMTAVSILLGISLFSPLCRAQKPAEDPGSQQKVLYIDSYHQGYKWSDDIEKGLFKSLGIPLNPDKSPYSPPRIQIKIFHMNTKINTGEDFKKKSALKAKNLIETWQPDLVVASDDNAAKYLIAPFYKNSALPFVFCGLNWGASEYGFPTPNITGMVEISPYIETIGLLRKFSRGPRMGIIGADGFSNRKELVHLKKIADIHNSDIRLISDFKSWKAAYLEFQDRVDMLIWISPIGISGWNKKEAEEFILKNTKIVTGGVADNNISYALLGRTKIAEEQGWWAGKTALKILNGTPPSAIPLATNQHSKLYLNMELAKRLGILFPVELIQKAILIGEEID